jgi:hypothetical protein
MPTDDCSLPAAANNSPPISAARRAMSAAARPPAPSFIISVVRSASQVDGPSSMLPVRTTARTVTFGTMP